MSLNLNPGYTYQATGFVSQPAGSPARKVSSQPQRPEPVQPEVAKSGSRSAQRSADYVAALRELRAESQHPRQSLAARTYLQVAHYEGNFQLVDVYT